MNEGPNRYGKIEIQPEGNIPPQGNGKKGEPVLTRRNFIKAATAAGVSFGLREFFKTKDIEQQTQEIPPAEKSDVPSVVPEAVSEPVSKEKVRMPLTPLEQILALGEVRDLAGGLEVYEEEHCSHYADTKDGLKDMETAVSNMKKYSLEKLTEPFNKYELPRELAYMIPIQETRGKNITSPAGAKGVSGIMPQTAKDLGFKLEHIEDPYLASKMTAKYLAHEREKRFGENADVEMLLYSYNAGGGLYGFTETVPEEKRTCENFYQYMEKYINTLCSEIKEKRYRHVIDDEDKTLSHVSERFAIPLTRILKANGFTERTVIHQGDSILIPYESMDEAAKIVFRKPLEALQYVPEIKAKYKALKESGLLSQVDKLAETEKSVLG